MAFDFQKKFDIALTPQRFAHLHQTPFQHKSVGVTAVISSFKQMLKYMTVADALKVASALNQKGGIDCPGCASARS